MGLIQTTKAPRFGSPWVTGPTQGRIFEVTTGPPVTRAGSAHRVTWDTSWVGPWVTSWVGQGYPVRISATASDGALAVSIVMFRRALGKSETTFVEQN